jgi:hypothetical protein
MTDSRLAAVARRIGMDQRDGIWWDDGEIARSWLTSDPICTSGQLRTYLTTGDRPMRILEELQLACVPTRLAADGVSCWMASAPGMPTFSGYYGDTPAEAILACAMAVPPEGLDTGSTTP